VLGTPGRDAMGLPANVQGVGLRGPCVQHHNCTAGVMQHAVSLVTRKALADYISDEVMRCQVLNLRLLPANRDRNATKASSSIAPSTHSPHAWG
jgi:hypothetical protein